MSKEYTTIRVEKAAKADADDAKTDGETWSEYLRRCTDHPPEVREYVDADAVSNGGNGNGDGGPVTLEASEYRKIADEVEGRLR